MSPRKPLRIVFVAVSAAAALTVAPALLTTSFTAPVAAAAPGEYPLSGTEDSPDKKKNEEKAEDGPAERAEKAGGGILSESIDLSADVLKCGLSIATPAISCPLGD